MPSIENILALEEKPDARPEDIVDVVLSTVRQHLGMEIAYLSEFEDGRSVFRAVSAPGLEHLIKPGDSRDLQDVYCQHILDGRLPRLMPDTAAEPLAATMPITTDTPIGSHVSVPVYRDDGSVYGMFCCLSPKPNPSLNDRDLAVMESFARLSAKQVNTSIRSRVEREALDLRIGAVLQNRQFNMVYQPIVDLASQTPAGFEALCRFEGTPYRPPNMWFDDAARIGKQQALEVAAISLALNALTALPTQCYLSVNASPDTVASGVLADVFSGLEGERIVLELTEHSMVGDQTLLAQRLSELAFSGVRVALDDAGAGYAGLGQILHLRPDMIKLDLSLTRDIDSDAARRSMVAAMVHFAHETGAKVVAEGIETESQLATLRDLGVQLGQGYLLGKPIPLADTLYRFDYQNHALSA